MKQILSAVLILCSFSLFAEQSFELGSRSPERTAPVIVDGLVWAQYYSYEDIQSGYSFFGEMHRWVADDFKFVWGFPYYYVNKIWIWTIWTETPCNMINVVISKDNGDFDPNTATVVWAEEMPCSHEFTGDTKWGYDIFETICTTVNWPLLFDYQHYWLELQSDPEYWGNCYVLVGRHNNLSNVWYNDGSGVWQRSDDVFGEDSDMFFLINDPTPGHHELESGTWGLIKTLF